MSDLTQEQIEQINEYAEALRQEFQAAKTASKSPREQRDDIQADLDDIVPDALAAITAVMRHSHNESLRVSTAKWLIDKKLETHKEENDPLNKFLDEMAKDAAEKEKLPAYVERKNNEDGS